MFPGILPPYLCPRRKAFSVDEELDCLETPEGYFQGMLSTLFPTRSHLLTVPHAEV